jgi:natural product biosynthesis luciferase-like monooxygenase protein
VGQLLIHRLFEQQVDRQPQAIALSLDNQLVSYGELNTRANLLAHRLHDLGVQLENVVVIVSELGVDTFVGSLAVLKAGGACVLLDANCPSTCLHSIIEDCNPVVVVTQEHLRERVSRFRNIPTIEIPTSSPTKCDATRSANLSDDSCSDNNLAYVLYDAPITPPVGVAIEHRNIIASLSGLSQAGLCAAGDTIIVERSSTPTASLIESLWSLCTGGRLALVNHAGCSPRSTGATTERLDFSLFYFSSVDKETSTNKYRLLIEGAQFADAAGLTGVWTPERHFHSFGGLFPNPSVTSAAIAVTTQRLKIRAGSVVLPLHHVLRVVEEWSVVDNLSGGRVELAFASGWNANDFGLAPDNYEDRRDIMFSAIDAFVKLWKGEAYDVRTGTGRNASVRVFPRPIQEQPAIWIAATGRQDTFLRAASIGAHVLTHLFDHSISGLAENIALYRSARSRSGYDPSNGRVALMLHTFLGKEKEVVKNIVRGPLINYLRSSIDLTQSPATETGRFSNSSLSSADLDKLTAFTFTRYFDGTALLGTVDDCLPLVRKLKSIGVDEIACLIDFGVDTDEVLESLHHLAELSDECARRQSSGSPSAYGLTIEGKLGLMHLTSSVLSRYLENSSGCAFVRSMPILVLAREALSPELLASVKDIAKGRVVLVYGCCETTLWSAACDIGCDQNLFCIGQPLCHTRFYILDDQKNPLPNGQIGEIYVGGAAVARGYLNKPHLTEERFLLDPFVTDHEARMYRTGQYGRVGSDGSIEASERTAS